MQPRFDRASGVLLHATSLPDGRLGPSADAFLRFLRAAGQSWWQMLPVVPADAAGSPYRSVSAFAGDPRLVQAPAPLPDDLQAFGERNREWIDDFALFQAIRREQGGLPWIDWPEPLRDRDPRALAEARARLRAEVDGVVAEQCAFETGWRAFKTRCERAGVRLMGDVPIFVAHDSADVWAHREIFKLDARGRPEVVTGVPPDYFSEEGQLWGNPHFRWGDAAYAWWRERLRRALALFDAVRLDHFLGFVRAWEIPAGAPSAKEGRYVPGPGAAFFDAVLPAIAGRRLVAEDLGVKTPEARALRERYGLPGMHVMQFAFGDDLAERPHAFSQNAVVYTGTHDNDTAVGWASDPRHAAEVALMRRYLGGDGRAPNWELIRGAWMSVCDLAIVPAQDLLGLGSEARMNRPGIATGNWRWRMAPGMPGREIAERLRDLTALYGR